MLLTCAVIVQGGGSAAQVAAASVLWVADRSGALQLSTADGEVLGEVLAPAAEAVAVDTSAELLWVFRRAQVLAFDWLGRLQHEVALTTDDTPRTDSVAMAPGVAADLWIATGYRFSLLPFGGANPIEHAVLDEDNGVPVAASCAWPTAALGECTPSAALVDGAVTLSLLLSDRAGKVSIESAVAAVVDSGGVDTTPPTISVVLPQWASEPSLSFSGSVDEELARFEINGVAETVATDLTFSHGPVALAEGANPLAFEAEDLAGNLATRNDTVHLDTQPPAITWQSPASAVSSSWPAAHRSRAPVWRSSGVLPALRTRRSPAPLLRMMHILGNVDL